MTKKLIVKAPFSNRNIAELNFDLAKDIESKITQAQNAFEKRETLFPLHHRIAFLEHLAKRVEQKKELFAAQAAEEGGKPLKDSRVELERAIQGINEAARSIKDLVGREIPMQLTESSLHRIAYTFREPMGVVCAISAFNHPFNLIVHQVIPALAVGSPVLVKPDLRTPLSCINLITTLYEAGLPTEMCQMILCDNDTCEKVATDPRVSFLTFIGSSIIGWKLRSKLAPGTRISLEHGGAAPVIVEPDADLKKTIPSLVKGGFYHAGQVCISVQRVFVHESIIDSFSEMIVKETKKLIVGDPLNIKTDVGPMILERECHRVKEWIEEALSKGASLLTGGKVLKNNCVSPTILYNPTDDAKVSVREIFGPVICLYPYKKLQDAIKRANQLPFSFQAAIFTKQIDNAFEAIKKLNASCVLVNDHTAFRVDWMPFYGRKESGIGVGGILPMMQEMTEEKLFIIQSEKL